MEHCFRYASSMGVITVPRGFRTDGASVPRIFWNIFDPFGPYFPAALIHDFLYSLSSDNFFKVNRATADALFREAMFNIGIGWLMRETIYRAVRIGGCRSFKKSRS